VLAGLLAACSALPVETPATFARTGAASQRDGGGSWMAPGANELDLLYVSDYESNDVDAYSYPQGKRSGVLKGVLNDFVLPTGLCADGAGNVFIPDNSNSTVLEYAHGSTKLVATLLDPGGIPDACAFDPATGNLAVVNWESVSGPGGIAVYAHGRGRPTNYTQGFVYKYFFDAYDDKGNLFVDATDAVPSQPFVLLELPKGGSSFKELTLNANVRVPGGVDWDGEHLAVGDSAPSVILRFAVAGSAGTEVGSTRLRRGRDAAQFLITGGAVIAASFHGASVKSWQYPNGGEPTRRIGGLGEPFGVALSKALK
jgi:hypothetical protein